MAAVMAAASWMSCGSESTTQGNLSEELCKAKEMLVRAKALMEHLQAKWQELGPASIDNCSLFCQMLVRFYSPIFRAEMFLTGSSDLAPIIKCCH